MTPEQLKALQDKMKAILSKKQEKKVEEVKKEIDYSKMTRDELLYDINTFFRARGQRLTNLKRANKERLIQIIKQYGVVHYTKEDKNENIKEKEIQKKKDEEKRKILNYQMLLDSYKKATNNEDLNMSYINNIKDLDEIYAIIRKYDVDNYDFTEYDREINERANVRERARFVELLQKRGLNEAEIKEDNNAFMYNIGGINLCIFKSKYKTINHYAT